MSCDAILYGPDANGCWSFLDLWRSGEQAAFTPDELDRRDDVRDPSGEPGVEGLDRHREAVERAATGHLLRGQVGREAEPAPRPGLVDVAAAGVAAQDQQAVLPGAGPEELGELVGLGQRWRRRERRPGAGFVLHYGR